MLHSQGVLNPNEPRAELVKKIASVTPKGLNKTIPVNTGAEAVEPAMKTARIYNKRSTVLTFQGGGHGKSFGALAVTSRRQYREQFEPIGLPRAHAPYPYCDRCPFDKELSSCGLFCAKYLENLLDNDSSGVSYLRDNPGAYPGARRLDRSAQGVCQKAAFDLHQTKDPSYNRRNYHGVWQDRLLVQPPRSLLSRK